MQKVPGLRRIRRTPETTEGFLPPHAAGEITFVVPPNIRQIVPEGRSVDLRATVDESGGVTRVELLSPKDEELVRLASYAANAWRFVPARVNDQPVPSEVILHFKFNGN